MQRGGLDHTAGRRYSARPGDVIVVAGHSDRPAGLEVEHPAVGHYWVTASRSWPVAKSGHIPARMAVSGQVGDSRPADRLRRAGARRSGRPGRTRRQLDELALRVPRLRGLAAYVHQPETAAR